MDLYRHGFIEPSTIPEKPYDILAHQLLSTIRETSGTTYAQLATKLMENYAFGHIQPQELSDITAKLIQDNQLEKIGNELIIGIQGEYTVNTKDFYSVFRTDPSFKVIHKDKTIGELPLMSTIQPDENILLAAKIWKITEVDTRAKKIFVVPDKDGKKHIFFGAGGEIHSKIRQRMLELIQEAPHFDELSEKATEALRQLHLLFRNFPIADLKNDRPVIIKHNEAQLYTFQGTRINRSLQFLLRLAKIDHDYNEHHSCFVLQTNFDGLGSALRSALEQVPNIEIGLQQALEETPELIGFSKWGTLLPAPYQLKILRSRYYDFEGATDFLEHIRLIGHQGQ